MFAKKTFVFLALVYWAFAPAYAQNERESRQTFEMTIENIMRDPKWIGVSPGRIYWSDDGKSVYFQWNPENAESDSLYVVSREGGTPRNVTLKERMELPARTGSYNKDRTKKVYEKSGDLFLLDIKSGDIRQITNTLDRESNPRFTHNERKITFMRNNNLYLWHIDSGETVQLTDYRRGEKRPEQEEPTTDQEKWLQKEELKLIQILEERKERGELAREGREAESPKRPKEIYIQDKNVQNIQLSSDELYITFRLAKSPRNAKRTIVPNYVTESAFSEDIQARTKVGVPQTTYEFGIYDIKRDSVYFVAASGIPGIYDQPSYLKEYETEGEKGKNRGVPQKERESKESGKPGPREVSISGLYWSDDGRHSTVVVASLDNKDRWIMSLNLTDGTLTNLDRQHDEAWVGGPAGRARNIGWMPDNRRLWFKSEESGYSHLYTVDVESGKKQQLTSGNYEIYNVQISRNKKYWYFTSNQVHPGERHFYRMPINGGSAVQITGMSGSNEVSLSPDEKMLAIRHSYSNKPWELYVMENKPGAKPKQVTFSLSEEFISYQWRDPEIITFIARDGAGVYARLYRPASPEPQGPAVIFVHGAGYTQNVHKWWSSYFREYMFHNLLTDNGYTVLDIDYRGSAGYGRDWRTAIYRYMGGRDLTDQVDGAGFLVDKYDVDPRRIGIYGGSYGGFITLMAMFTQPGVFSAGAALRPVTDWAHYNHPYTSNILNLPYSDTIAYERSSPIYHASGLKGALLICHGMIDTNVHFQDAVRLVQRLIELGKENWELAVYPLEGHGFREPSSWTDEYKRIFKLFEENLK